MSSDANTTWKKPKQNRLMIWIRTGFGIGFGVGYCFLAAVIAEAAHPWRVVQDSTLFGIWSQLTIAFAGVGVVGSELAYRGAIREPRQAWQLRLSSLLIWMLLVSFNLWIGRTFLTAIAESPLSPSFREVFFAAAAWGLFLVLGLQPLVLMTTSLFTLATALLRRPPRTRPRVSEMVVFALVCAVVVEIGLLWGWTWGLLCFVLALKIGLSRLTRTA